MNEGINESVILVAGWQKETETRLQLSLTWPRNATLFKLSLSSKDTSL